MQIQTIRTPKVVEYARSHYGCSALQGMPLEDLGHTNDGTMGAHWEARVAGDECTKTFRIYVILFSDMVGEIGDEMRLSKLSFYLLEDSGYYQVNTDKLESWHYGRGEGCSFVTGPCQNWTYEYFCTEKYHCPFILSLFYEACNGNVGPLALVLAHVA